MKRMRWNVLLIGALMVLGGLLTLSGCGRAEALDTLYEGEGPTIITYDEAYEMLEAGKTFFYYEGHSFDMAGKSKESKTIDDVFKSHELHYFIIDTELYTDDRVALERFYGRSTVGLAHEGEVTHGDQNFVAVNEMTQEDIRRGVDADVTRLLSLVEE